MGADEFEEWKAHFRERNEYETDFHSPVPHREKTIEEYIAQATETAQQLHRIGRT